MFNKFVTGLSALILSTALVLMTAAPASAFNMAFHFGSALSSTITQVQSGNGNFSLVVQNGKSETATHVQVGGNNWMASWQDGRHDSLTGVQVGNGNGLLVWQSATGGVASGNTSTTVQSGNDNLHTVVQIGRLNTETTSQIGSNNFSGIYQNGTGNTASVVQVGNCGNWAAGGQVGDGNTLVVTQTCS